MEKKGLRQGAAMGVQMALGLFLCALGYRMFLIPNGIAPGGFTGIGQLISHMTGWPVGMIMLALNAPLFLAGARSLGWAFGLRSLICTIGLSLLLDHLPVPMIIPIDSAERLMPAAIFGGVLGGLGLGLVIRANSTTGGGDLLAWLIRHRYPFASVGALIFLIDALVIAASAVVFDVFSAMFAMIAAFIMGLLIDYVVTGFNSAHAYLIISSRSDEVARAVLEKMARGATALYGHGAYSKNAQEVLLCVVNRTETPQLRKLVAEIDANAFLIAMRASEVLGQGFSPHPAPAKRRSRGKAN